MTTVIEAQRGLIELGYDPEVLRRLVARVEQLIAQGQRLRHVASGGLMVLFMGKIEGRVVDIQLQVGGDVRQLFVLLLDEDGSVYKVRYNHQHEVNFVQDIEDFVKTQIDQGTRQRVLSEYPRGLVKIRFDKRGTNIDLAYFVSILEQTQLDHYLLDRVIEHDTCGGRYFKDEGVVFPRRIERGMLRWLKRR